MSKSTSIKLDEEFQKAVKRVSESKKPEVTNEIKLNFYGAYKQANCGDNNTPKPSALFGLSEAAYKWNAWTKFKGWSKESAKQYYIDLVKLHKL